MSVLDEPRRPRRFELPWTAGLALRYLRSGRKDAYVSFLSAVACGGIALGVAALVLALAALNGLQQALRDEVLRRTSEVEVHPVDPAATAGLEERVRRLAGDGVAVHRQVRGAGWIVRAGGGRAVEIHGYEGALPASLPATASRASGTYLSDRLARYYGLEAGDLLQIASTRPTLSPLGPVPRMRRTRLAGTFEHPVLREGELVAVPLDLGRDLLGEGSLRLVVSTGSLDGAVALGERLERELGGEARVVTWRELNAPLLLALRLEKRLMFVAVFLVVLVGSLALVSDLSLIVANRRREIGILGTMGARGPRLRRVFLLLGGILASLGLVIGGLLGVVAAILLDRFRAVQLPGGSYLLDHVPFVTEPLDLVWVVILTLATALICSWIGASKATALAPVEALRS
ncbi:MAG: FtsX-like permease family protein [Thermoanaerobaculia bacterium]|nr:FtsX-like permease family protein [Thermoanaerobaculia bacterium]